MANQLKMAVVHAILTLAGLGWSHRWIAQVLGVDHETVARYVHASPSEAKPATNPIPGPESRCEPCRAVIAARVYLPSGSRTEYACQAPTGPLRTPPYPEPPTHG